MTCSGNRCGAKICSGRGSQRYGARMTGGSSCQGTCLASGSKRRAAKLRLGGERSGAGFDPGFPMSEFRCGSAGLHCKGGCRHVRFAASLGLNWSDYARRFHSGAASDAHQSREVKFLDAHTTAGDGLDPIHAANTLSNGCGEGRGVQGYSQIIDVSRVRGYNRALYIHRALRQEHVDLVT